MAFTTLAKRDWRMILENSRSCEAALARFPEYARVATLGDWTKEFYGKNWETDQNIITAQLIKKGICTLPPGHRVRGVIHCHELSIHRHKLSIQCHELSIRNAYTKLCLVNKTLNFCKV